MAALRFTNKQEARPLPPCWGWSPVLIAPLAQRGRGSPGFTRQLPGRGGGGVLGPMARKGSPALCTYLAHSWDSLTENQSEAPISPFQEAFSNKAYPVWIPLTPLVLRWSSFELVSSSLGVCGGRMFSPRRQHPRFLLPVSSTHQHGTLFMGDAQ